MALRTLHVTLEHVALALLQTQKIIMFILAELLNLTWAFKIITVT